MPEPPVPGKGPFMRSPQAVAAAAAQLFKTDGCNAWLELQRGSAARMSARGFRSAAAAGRAAAGGERPGRGLSGEEQRAANQSGAAMEGVQKRDDDIPTQVPRGGLLCPALPVGATRSLPAA